MGAYFLPLDVGETVYRRAVAQQKPELRKAWLAAAAHHEGEYKVRYVGGGVRIERLS